MFLERQVNVSPAIAMSSFEVEKTFKKADTFRRESRPSALLAYTTGAAVSGPRNPFSCIKLKAQIARDTFELASRSVIPTLSGSKS